MPKCQLLSCQEFQNVAEQLQALKPQDPYPILKYMTYKWHDLGPIT